MSTFEERIVAKREAISRRSRVFEKPVNSHGQPLAVSDYFGDNAFDATKSKLIPKGIRRNVKKVIHSRQRLEKDQAEVIAAAVTSWAIAKGCTHFCHWFQPLTGGTAEKHDAFLSFEGSEPIETLTVSQLLQGEPDASSFPNGGARTTFEARGYTTWDLSSPMFIIEGPNGKTLCIPTAFVSYTGESLDNKTPLLKSLSYLSEQATRFYQLIDEKVSSVFTTVGCEQEYFLVDKALYYTRPDLVMTGRTVLGASSEKNQQLDDHYFGIIPERVMSFMQELDQELYKLGIPAKTRHNEVAPGQYEIAPIFNDANVAADQNQLIMATIKSVAEKHDLVAILHEKPFAGMNGSGKHVNWSISDDKGRNKLEPGKDPSFNLTFLASVSIVLRAVHDHAAALRMSIASVGNDHRLGANEAPPAIISVFLGDALEKIFEGLVSGGSLPEGKSKVAMDVGAQQLMSLMKDNTDRNRTSPFAFTGNKFEFRAVGATMPVNLPVSVLNAAVADAFKNSSDFVQEQIQNGKPMEDALYSLIERNAKHAHKVIFNGDGYSDEWVAEAESRGLPHLRTTPDALGVLRDEAATQFLVDSGVMNRAELKMRYNVLIERYNTLRQIEFETLLNLVNQSIIPAAISYKTMLAQNIKSAKDLGMEADSEMNIYQDITSKLNVVVEKSQVLHKALKNEASDDTGRARSIVEDMLPTSFEVADAVLGLELVIPDHLWPLAKFQELLFMK